MIDEKGLASVGSINDDGTATIDPPTIDPLCYYTGVNCREI